MRGERPDVMAELHGGALEGLLGGREGSLRRWAGQAADQTAQDWHAAHAFQDRRASRCLRRRGVCRVQVPHLPERFARALRRLAFGGRERRLLRRLFRRVVGDFMAVRVVALRPLWQRESGRGIRGRLVALLELCDLSVYERPLQDLFLPLALEVAALLHRLPRRLHETPEREAHLESEQRRRCALTRCRLVAVQSRALEPETREILLILRLQLSAQDFVLQSLLRLLALVIPFGADFVPRVGPLAVDLVLVALPRP